MTNDEAKATIAELLAVTNPKTTAHPLWLKVVDICLWANKTLAEGSKQHKQRTKAEQIEYRRLSVRDAMRRHRARKRTGS